MNTIAAECPVCHVTNQYDPDTGGKYPVCPNCGARFYVTVPPLVDSEGKLVLASSSPVIPSKWPIPGDQHANNEPQNVVRLVRRLTWLVVALLVLGLVNLAAVAILLVANQH